MDDQETTPTPTPPAEPAPAPADNPTGDRYAAYDVDHQRFIGRVCASKSDAGKSDAVKAAKDKGHRVEVRKV